MQWRGPKLAFSMILVSVFTALPAASFANARCVKLFESSDNFQSKDWIQLRSDILAASGPLRVALEAEWRKKIDQLLPAERERLIQSIRSASQKNQKNEVPEKLAQQKATLQRNLNFEPLLRENLVNVNFLEKPRSGYRFIKEWGVTVREGTYFKFVQNDRFVVIQGWMQPTILFDIQLKKRRTVSEHNGIMSEEGPWYAYSNPQGTWALNISTGNPAGPFPGGIEHLGQDHIVVGSRRASVSLPDYYTVHNLKNGRSFAIGRGSGSIYSFKDRLVYIVDGQMTVYDVNSEKVLYRGAGHSITGKMESMSEEFVYIDADQNYQLFNIATMTKQNLGPVSKNPDELAHTSFQKAANGKILMSTRSRLADGSMGHKVLEIIDLQNKQSWKFENFHETELLNERRTLVLLAQGYGRPSRMIDLTQRIPHEKLIPGSVKSVSTFLDWVHYVTTTGQVLENLNSGQRISFPISHHIGFRAGSRAEIVVHNKRDGIPNYYTDLEMVQQTSSDGIEVLGEKIGSQSFHLSPAGKYIFTNDDGSTNLWRLPDLFPDESQKVLAP